MTKIFNSVFEMQLRILLLLSQSKRPFSKEEIVDYDFITVYGADFGIGDDNLHGENRLKYGEFASRHELAWIALKQLVVDGAVLVVTKDGFTYKISPEGMKHINALESAYAVDYRETARKVLQKYINYSEEDLDRIINEKTVASVRRDR